MTLAGSMAELAAICIAILAIISNHIEFATLFVGLAIYANLIGRK